MRSGNCALLSPNEDSLFAIKLNYKKPKEQENDELDYYLLAERCNNLFLNSITEYVFYYISSRYVVEIISKIIIILPHLKCQYFIRAIIDSPSVQDHSYLNTEDNIKSIKNVHV